MLQFPRYINQIMVTPDCHRSSETPSPKLSIDVLTDFEYSQVEPSLERYRALVYALYTTNGQPTEITNTKPLHHSTAKYVIAHSSEISPHLSSGNNSLLQRLESEFKPFHDIAGLFRIEYGITSHGSLPIEAMQLLQYQNWPQNTKIGYFSQFSPNPLLPKPMRQNVLNQLFSKASQVVHQEVFDDYAYVILADHVLKFVQDAGITAIHQPGAILDWSDTEAKNIFETFPKYWDNNPQLYKFIPFPLDSADAS